MPAQLSDFEQIRASQARARELGLQASQLQAGATTFEDEVRNRIQEARAARGTSQLAQDIGTVTGQLASEGPALRERTLEVNPLDVDRMLGAQRGQLLGSLGTLAQVGQEREGTIADVIGAGTNRMVAQAQMRQAEAEMAAQEARDLMALLGLQAKLAEGAADEGLGGLDLSDSVKTKAAGYQSRLKDLYALKTLLGQEAGLFEDVGRITTGPLASLLGQYGPGGQTRADLETLVDALRYSSYGGAFTETELKVGRKWMPSSGRQESTNIRRINSQINKDVNKLTSLLNTHGVPSEIVSAYISQANPPLGVSGGGLDSGWVDTGKVEER